MLRQKMLHRSFKPSKCKTALKLATSRIKLLKNKKEVQLKQMKRDLAQLLESGQNQTARIRVEHVIREEKMMAAYDLIEIFCELISIRLPVIESQKNCPIDLKEAITSVIFASPRCADVPELLDIRKHFTAKYGKEFTTAAIELRPECGVSRMLVEKLSAMAPDAKTKIKVLSSIAEEHNIKWDPESFAEKELKPSDDLLNGPTTFEKASVMHAEPLSFQAPVDHDQKHKTPLSFSHQNPRSSPGNQNLAYSDSGGMGTSTTLPDVRPSATGADASQSFSIDSNTLPLANQNWNMEFKDATAAAQAAAESAERASMAARAAAELSRQHSESQKSSVHSSRDENVPNYAASKYLGDDLHKDSVSNSFPDRVINLQGEIKGKENDNPEGLAKTFHRDVHGVTQMPSHSASLRPTKSSIDDDTLVGNMQTVDGYNLKGSFEEEVIKKVEKGSLFDEASMWKQSPESNVEFGSDLRDNFEPQNLGYFGEERHRTQLDIPSQSHANAYTDDSEVWKFNHPGVGNDAGEKPIVEQSTVCSDPIQTSSHDDTAVVFDESGSDDDDYRFDTGPKYDESGSNSYFMSEGRKSPVHLSTNTGAWSPRTSMNKSTIQPHESTERHSTEFSESFGNSVDYSEPTGFMPVTFDESDGPKSESEGEVDKSKLSGEKISRSNEEIISPSDDFHSMEVHLMSNQRTELNGEVSNTLKDDESQYHSNSESEKGLNFGMLMGGLRNKGYIRPLYVKNPYGDVLSSSQKVAGGGTNTVKQSPCTPTSQSSSNSGENMNVDNKVSSRMPLTDSDSDMDDSEEEFAQQPLSSRQERNARKVGKDVNTKSNVLRAPDTFFDSNSDDSGEDLPKQTFPSRSHLSGGISRRTRTSSSSSYYKVRVEAEASVTSSTERKPRNSYGNGTPPKPPSQNVMSGSSGNSGQPISTKEESSKLMPENRTPGREESSKVEEIERPYSLRQKTVASGSNEDAKTSSSGETSAVEKPIKKASHVHPKLPDYDTLASRLQSLRSNR